MSVSARFYVDRIMLQKDEFAARKGESDPFTMEEFFAGKEREGLVQHFKRFKVDGRVEAGVRSGPYGIIISLRGNIATFTADKTTPLTPYGVFWAYEAELGRWNHRRHANDRDVERPLLPVDLPDAKAIRATVRDGFWFADVLHHIKDDPKGFSKDGFPEMFVRP